MDGDRFDALTRALGSGRSRRSMLRGLGAAALGAAGLSRAGRADAADLGNSPCAHFCVAVFPPGPARGACVSAAAHGTGPCVACGANPANYCGGACTNVQTDVNNCGVCGNVCPSDACNAATCIAGVCGTTPTNAGGICAAAPDHCTNPSTCDATGACVAGGPINCDDQNACTTDTCDPTTGCVYTVVNCDDGNECTTDSCDSASGCVHTANAGASCQNGTGVCDATGACVNNCAGVTCTALDECHVAGTCDPATGACSNPNAADGTPCEGGAGTCQSGACVLNPNVCTDIFVCNGGTQGCSNNPGCFCDTTTEGNNVCDDFGNCNFPCASSADCPANSHCVTSTCCGGPVCISVCGQPELGAAIAAAALPGAAPATSARTSS